MVCLHRLVLYGLYPYVVDQLSERLKDTVLVGVTIRLASTVWRVELHHVDVNGLRSVVIGVLAAGVDYERRLSECCNISCH